MSLKQLQHDLKVVNGDIKTLQHSLIKQLNTTSIDKIDLYYYINTLDALKMRKTKIMTLIALEY